MKLFTGVEVPQTVVAEINNQLQDLRNDYPDFNWVPPQNFVIDLVSIGSVKDEYLTQIIDGIADELYDVEGTHIFSLGIEMVITHQIVLYVTFQRNKQLEIISDRILKLLMDEEKAKKLKYEPRLHVARYKIPSKQQYFHLKKKLTKIDIEVNFPIKDIHLYESMTGKDNPIYRDLATIPLQEEL